MLPSAKRQRFVSAKAGDGTDPLNEQDFDALVAELKAFDEQREVVIKRSRDIQKLSKQAIFSLHRGKDAEAAQRLGAAEAATAELLPLIARSPALRAGSFASAMEEYAEAVVFRVYLNEHRLPTRGEVANVEPEEYLGGLLDFTGELNRVAVVRATARDKAAVQDARDLAEALQGQFLRFDLRNGSLRKKMDGLKYVVKNLENTLYELSLTERGLPTKPAGGVPGAPGASGPDVADDADNDEA